MRQSLHRRSFQNCLVSFDVIQDLGVEYEKAPIDPSFAALGFLVKLKHPVVLKPYSSKPCWRPYSCYCGELAVLPMEVEQCLYVDIGHTIPIRAHKRFVFF